MGLNQISAVFTITCMDKIVYTSKPPCPGNPPIYWYDAFALLRGGYQKVHNVEEDTASRRGVGGDTHLEVTRERNVLKQWNGWCLRLPYIYVLTLVDETRLH